MLLGVASVKAVGDMPVSLFLHPGVGWCDSDLDAEPCSFDCAASCYMDEADIAVMCYEACVRDFPDETIEACVSLSPPLSPFFVSSLPASFLLLM